MIWKEPLALFYVESITVWLKSVRKKHLREETPGIGFHSFDPNFSSFLDLKLYSERIAGDRLVLEKKIQPVSPASSH